MRTLVTGAAAMAAAISLAGATVGTAEANAPMITGVFETGRFVPVDPAAERQAPALTYDPQLVPEGAEIMVHQRVIGGAMSVQVTVDGLVPGRTYGTHVHLAPCGADPAAALGHYRNVPDVVTPENEVWLDLTADSSGTGRARAEQEWVFRAGEAASVVLHERGTSHGHDGHAPGDAGGRVACFSVPFQGASATA
ncbi:superoxide dismutase family protein [Streptomyces radicis]|uniref:superoxide dismutase family protein n=1 Tax=Streptomyces radicis TaxID=1750517 RepID=UPI001E52CF0E|nr:superoxide dismutase family protein [Streptomyces radicis]